MKMRVLESPSHGLGFRVPWSDSLSWLAHCSHRAWSKALRADGEWDAILFTTPMLFGVLRVVSLVAGKYLQHSDIAWLIAGSSTACTILLLGLSTSMTYHWHSVREECLVLELQRDMEFGDPSDGEIIATCLLRLASPD